MLTFLVLAISTVNSRLGSSPEIQQLREFDLLISNCYAFLVFEKEFCGDIPDTFAKTWRCSSFTIPSSSSKIDIFLIANNFGWESGLKFRIFVLRLSIEKSTFQRSRSEASTSFSRELFFSLIRSLRMLMFLVFGISIVNIRSGSSPRTKQLRERIWLRSATYVFGSVLDLEKKKKKICCDKPLAGVSSKENLISSRQTWGLVHTLLHNGNNKI